MHIFPCIPDAESGHRKYALYGFRAEGSFRLPERNGSFMKIKRQSALLTAAVCALLMTGCGGNSSVTGAADAGTRTSRSTTAETTTTVPGTTTTAPAAATVDGSTVTESHSTDASANRTDSATSTTGKSLKDRAESALDSIGDAVTSLLTEATRPR